MTDEQNAEVPATQAAEPKSDDQQGASATSPTQEQADGEEEKSDTPEQSTS